MQASPGAYNLNAPDPVSLREITRRIGARVMALPPSMIYPLAGAAWKLHLRALSEAPPAMLDYIRYPWVADGSKVTHATDFRYRYNGHAAWKISCIAARWRRAETTREHYSVASVSAWAFD